MTLKYNSTLVPYLSRYPTPLPSALPSVKPTAFSKFTKNSYTSANVANISIITKSNKVTNRIAQPPTELPTRQPSSRTNKVAIVKVNQQPNMNITSNTSRP